MRQTMCTILIIRSLAACALVLLAGCIKAPDTAAIEAARARPIQRHDTVQAIATRGDLVVAGTQAGNVLTSADAGKSWTRVAVGSASIIDLTVCPDGTFLGLDFYHKVWSSSPDARRWMSHTVSEPHTPLAITCGPDSKWWIAGTNATIASSADAGRTWETTNLNMDAQLTGVQFLSPLMGVAVGEFGLMFVTEDAGKTWAKRTSIPNDFYPCAMLFVSPNEGWVSGLAGQILHTNDAGASWEKQENTTHQSIYRLFLHNAVPHGVGAAGAVVQLDGGVWEPVLSRNVTQASLAAGAALTETNTLVVGGPGGVLMNVNVEPLQVAVASNRNKAN